MTARNVHPPPGRTGGRREHRMLVAPLPPDTEYFVTVRSRDDVDEDHATLSLRTLALEDGRALIALRDNGPRIPPEVLPRTFDPFFTTKDVGEGSGLGLSIVHGIVERHDGTIEVDSRVGQGTTFTVSLSRDGVSATASNPGPRLRPANRPLEPLTGTGRSTIIGSGPGGEMKTCPVVLLALSPAMACMAGGSGCGGDGGGAQPPPPFEFDERVLSPGVSSFGGYLAVRDGRIVAGATTTATARGAAYVIEQEADAWTALHPLIPPPLEMGDYFGGDVALDDVFVLVGSPGEDQDGENAGAVHVFTLPTYEWQTTIRLPSTDLTNATAFGASIAARDGRAAIGMWNSDAIVPYGGAAYHVPLGEGALVAERVPVQGLDAGTDFGWSVATAHDLLVVGDTEGVSDAGAAYVFTWSADGWTDQQALAAPEPVSLDQFGGAVAVGDGFVAVGAPRRDTPAVSNSGATYVFAPTTGGWTLEARLESPTPRAGEGFGGALAAWGEYLLVGESPQDGFPEAGRVHLYRRGEAGWELEDILHGQGGTSQDEEFGRVVAIDEGVLVIGARANDEVGLFAGAVYIWTQPPAP